MEGEIMATLREMSIKVAISCDDAVLTIDRRFPYWVSWESDIEVVEFIKIASVFFREEAQRAAADPTNRWREDEMENFERFLRREDELEGYICEYWEQEIGFLRLYWGKTESSPMSTVGFFYEKEFDAALFFKIFQAVKNQELPDKVLLLVKTIVGNMPR